MVPSWGLVDANVKCRFSSKSKRGTYHAAVSGLSEPVKDQNEEFIILFPGNYEIVESDRFENITDTSGNILEVGPLMVDSTVMITDWWGKKHHTVAKLKRVTAT